MPMAHVVTLHPSGHRFEAEEGENILEAALRSRLAVSYQCTNGSCGDCRARILEGRLAEHLHHDYVFKGNDRLYPMLLMCRARPASDMLIETAEAQGIGDIPEQHVAATVYNMEHADGKVMVLHLRTPRSQTLRFLAGQYVSLTIEGVGQRSKSIASCPCNGRELQFIFRRTPGDDFSEHVFQHLKKRDAVQIDGPYGEYLLEQHSEAPILFLCYDTGFAAVKSLVEHLISQDALATLRLHWHVLEDTAPLENHCRVWRNVLDDFDFRILRGTTATPGAADTASALVKSACEQMDVLAEADIFITCPEGMFADISRELAAKGVHHGRMFPVLLT
jgi:CDP-4-dehydro-6-deoxyglucose reductase